MSPRARFVIRRLLLTIPVLFAMSVFVFLIIRLVPGDPVRTMLGFRATDANVAQIREQLGLNESLVSSTCTGSAACCTATSAPTSSARRRCASCWPSESRSPSSSPCSR